MLFNSLQFLLFFPIVCIIYWVFPAKWRNPLLLVASYYFYMNWEPIYALLILFSTLTTWACSLKISLSKTISTRKKWLIGCLVVNFGILFVFKYFNFITESVFAGLSILGLRMEVPHFGLLLPVGISFYTFQAVGYIVDVYKRKIQPEKNLGTYALFVAFFPQLVAGPIERASNLLPQFPSPHSFDGVEAIEGLKSMLFGYFMKLCIADNVSSYVDAVYNNISMHNGTSIFLATIFFTFQILCDFAGYSLIAIGAARVMGFTLMDNFRQPYLATSPKDLWKRWHISLSSWFTEYVYIPLGGNRCSKWRHSANTMATMALSGLWHGANWTFILWGIYHGALLVAYHNLKRLSIPVLKIRGLAKALNILVTFLLVMFGWVFFRANNIGEAFTAFKKMLTEPGPLFTGPGVPELLLSILLIGVLMLHEVFIEWKWNIRYFSRPWLLRDVVFSVILLATILLCGQFDGGQFIYFQF